MSDNENLVRRKKEARQKNAVGERIGKLVFIMLPLSSSCHPQHTKKAIPFSLALHLRRICSTDAKFALRLNELKTYLLSRGYGNTFLDSQFKRATNISRAEALRTNRHDSIDRLPFVVTYNPSFPHISNILRKHFHILLSSKRCREVFQYPPIVAYRRTQF